MAAKRRTLRTILQSTASRKSFRFVSKDELTRVGLSPNTKLLVPKTLKRVTKNTEAIKPSELKKVGKSRGAKREKLLERAASKIVKLDKASSQQTVKRQKRRDTEFVKAEKSTATQKGITRRARADNFPAYFTDRMLADAAKKTRIDKAGGKNKGKPSLVVRRKSATDALENRAKRLRGEHIPDGEYQAMLDYMAHYNDPFYERLRASPDVKGSRIRQ
jgi:hypothetical protein